MPGGRLKADRTPDMRCRENRTRGYNMDGSLDMRYSFNKSSCSSSSSSSYCSSPSYCQSPSYSPVYTFSWYDRESEYRARREREERERREREERERRERERERERAEIARRQRELEEQERRERERRERERRELEQKRQAAESSFATKRADAKTSAINEESAVLEGVISKAYDDNSLNQQQQQLTVDTLKVSVAKLLRAMGQQERVRRAVSEKVSEVAPRVAAAAGIQHLNAVVVGKTGVGKSTLLNAVLGLDGGSDSDSAAAETGVGRPVTQGKPKEYTAVGRGGLRLWDTKGIEVGAYGPAAVVADVKDLVDRTARSGDPDACIHAVWYCVLTQSGRLEDVERDALVELMRVYDGGKLPVVVVLTQAYSRQDAAAMEAEVRRIVEQNGNGNGSEQQKGKGQSKGQSKDDKEAKARVKVRIVSVVAKEKEMDEFTIKPRGIDTLLHETCACAVSAALPACQHSVRAQVEDALCAAYRSPAFCRARTPADTKAAERQSGLRAKMALLADTLRAVCEQAGVIVSNNNKEECTKAIRDSGVMEVVLQWAVDAFGKVSDELAEAGERLGAKYAEAQHQVERSSGCQVSAGKSLSEWKAAAKKEVADALREKAECMAFRKAAERVAPVFADALSMACVDMVKAEVASADAVAQQIERAVGEAVRKASEEVLAKKK